MSCGLSQLIAIRFNFHKIAPLGIADNDYRRIAMAVNCTEEDVESACRKYHKQNKAVAEELEIKSEQISKPVRICFIGDSITSERTSYMNIIRDAFEGNHNAAFLDCAISGWKSSDVIYEFEGRVPAFKPDIIHIMVGTNDARNARPGTDSSTAGHNGYRRNIECIVRLAKDTGAKVILTTVPPTEEAAPLNNGVIPVWEFAAFNTILREVSSEQNIPLNDMEQELTAELDKIIDVFDHVHLNAYGQKLMAKGVYAYLLDELKK